MYFQYIEKKEIILGDITSVSTRTTYSRKHLHKHVTIMIYYTTVADRMKAAIEGT